MSVNSKKMDIIPMVLGIMIIVSLILFLFFDVFYIKGTSLTTGVKGFNSIFGINFKASGKSLNFKTVNGYGCTILILLVISGICSTFFSSYHRGFHIVSFIADIFTITFMFCYSVFCFKTNFSNQHSAYNNIHVGFGQITAGVVMCLHAIGCIIGFKLTKKKHI